MTQVSFAVLLGILAGVVALFVAIRQLSLPSSFYKNQEKRAEMARNKLRKEDENRDPEKRDGEKGAGGE